MKPRSAGHFYVMRKTAFFLLTTVVIAGALSVLRAPVLEGKMLGALRPFYILLFPPEDLYRVLVRFPIDPREHGTAYSFTLDHRYVGAYTAGLFVEKGFDYFKKETWLFRLGLRCTAGSTSFSAELGSNPSPFLGLHGDGFSLVWYQVPKDLPQGVDTKCQLQVLREDVELSKRFGRTDFHIKKQSDL